MTAAEHLARAEALLATIAGQSYVQDGITITALALEAQGHALIALAAELGVPHADTTETGAGHDVP